MLEFFKKKKQKQHDSLGEWLNLIQVAKTRLPDKMPELKASDAIMFIEEWNRQYECASEEEKIGLAVLAYQIHINQYATGMLIEGKEAVRLNGIKLLGYMRDESSWRIMSSLVKHDNTNVSFAAFKSSLQINERRACDEFMSIVFARRDWIINEVVTLLKKVDDVDVWDAINKIDTSAKPELDDLKQVYLERLRK